MTREITEGGAFWAPKPQPTPLGEILDAEGCDSCGDCDQCRTCTDCGDVTSVNVWRSGTGLGKPFVEKRLCADCQTFYTDLRVFWDFIETVW